MYFLHGCFQRYLYKNKGIIELSGNVYTHFIRLKSSASGLSYHEIMYAGELKKCESFQISKKNV